MTLFSASGVNHHRDNLLVDGLYDQKVSRATVATRHNKAAFVDPILTASNDVEVR